MRRMEIGAELIQLLAAELPGSIYGVNGSSPARLETIKCHPLAIWGAREIFEGGEKGWQIFWEGKGWQNSFKRKNGERGLACGMRRETGE